ncbi:MAG: dethiobiotin synthase [Bacteroidia bacterium]|nr:dethiobiotin synthase [Bacteroidia bacterium]MDW8134780.1 dethiobiotin synthase [Bacteroidia bacterium]
MQGIVITGIHTEVGKTWVATALAAGMSWTYWKPIQTGTPTDTERVMKYGVSTLPERYRLIMPAAPLVAAEAEGRTIDWEYLAAPPPVNNLIIEGAGGLFVPITYHHFLIDLFVRWKLPVILVVRPYLGAMNHTWLSIHAMRAYGIPLLGIILNGTTGDPSENYFRKTFSLLAELPWDPQANPHTTFVQSGLNESLSRALANIS